MIHHFIPRSAMAWVLVCGIPLSACQGGLFGHLGYLESAEGLAREERYEDAIEVYRRHIDHRLAVRDRPDWENPYLYYLTIGDLELKMGDPTRALESYEAAEREQVDQNLVADRYRLVARYYEEQNNREEAIRVLTRYRDRDPLLFDGMMDRISKDMIREEEATGSESED